MAGDRPSWDQTWMAVADQIAQRSWCVRRKAGCVIVSKVNRVVSMGYNGPPAGIRVDGPCDQWCERAKTGGGLSYDDCLAAHSEINAFMHASRELMEGGTLYVTSCPCFACAKAIANSGVTRVVLRVTTEDENREPWRTLQLLERAGVTVIHWAMPWDRVAT